MRKKVKKDVVKVEKKEDNSFFKSALNNADMFNNVQTAHVITIDVSKATHDIDYMSMSRVAMFRSAVKRDLSFDSIALIDFRFYRDTNDRSKSQKENKQSDLLTYARKRTSKQLRDVLQEKDIVAYLRKKYNFKQDYLTVSDYQKIVK